MMTDMDRSDKGCYAGIDEEMLKRHLRGLKTGRSVIYHDSIDSTNLEARRAILQGYGEGTVIIADEQTSGRGRLGRTWFSPIACGIWMSVLLEQRLPMAECGIVPISAAVAAAEGIFSSTGMRVGIKWPNDLILDGRKVCGILAEAGIISPCDTKYIIVGFGINVFQSTADFPGELAKSAVSLRQYAPDAKLDRNMIAAEVLAAFDRYCIEAIPGRVPQNIERWKRYDITLGKAVAIADGRGMTRGIAADLDNAGALMVRTESGDTVRAVAGEATILKEGENP